MNKFYIVCNSYHPNTAYTNRVFSFLRGFSELGVDTEVVFLAPDKDRSTVQEQFPHINYKYMWGKFLKINTHIRTYARAHTRVRLRARRKL